MFGQVQDTVKVGSVLIDVETGDSSAPTSSPPKPQPTPAAAPSAPSAPSGGVQQFKLVAGPTLKSFWILKYSSMSININNYFFPNHSKSIEADIGEGIAEVQLTEWFVKEGDMARNLSPPVNLHWKTTSNKRLSYDFHMTFLISVVGEPNSDCHTKCNTVK